MRDKEALSKAIKAGLMAGHSSFLLVANDDEGGVAQAVLNREDDLETRDGEPRWSVSILAANPYDDEGRDLPFDQRTIDALLALDVVRFGLLPTTIPDQSERDTVNRRRLAQPSPAWGILIDSTPVQPADFSQETVDSVWRGLVLVDRVLRPDPPARYKIISW